MPPAHGALTRVCARGRHGLVHAAASRRPPLLGAKPKGPEVEAAYNTWGRAWAAASPQRHPGCVAPGLAAHRTSLHEPQRAALPAPLKAGRRSAPPYAPLPEKRQPEVPQARPSYTSRRFTGGRPVLTGLPGPADPERAPAAAPQRLLARQRQQSRADRCRLPLLTPRHGERGCGRLHSRPHRALTRASSPAAPTPLAIGACSSCPAWVGVPSPHGSCQAQDEARASG